MFLYGFFIKVKKHVFKMFFYLQMNVFNIYVRNHIRVRRTNGLTDRQARCVMWPTREWRINTRVFVCRLCLRTTITTKTGSYRTQSSMQSPAISRSSTRSLCSTPISLCIITALGPCTVYGSAEND